MKENKDKSNIKKIAICVGFGVISIWGLSWFLIDCYYADHTERGTFGDQFGAVNALFAGLAFAGLIITLLYQKEELKLQREELAETRKELKGQREEFEEQNKTLKQQRFENTFFNMLSLQQEIASNLSFEYVKITGTYTSKITESHSIKIQFHGREVFEGMYKEANISYKGRIYGFGIRTIINNFGNNEYINIPSTTRFDHYFRHLYRIFKYIDSSDLIKDKDKYKYTCIVRSQLSDYELVMLFYNCLSSNGIEKFKPLIEKYAILNNLRKELLANIDDINLYPYDAYNYSKESY